MATGWSLAVVGWIAAVASQDPIARELERVRNQHGVPALGVVAVTRDGAVVRGVVGVRHVGKPDLVQPHDPWHIGSCGKAMTATLLARVLAEDPDHSWDTTVGEVFSDLRDSMHADARAITLRQLVDHRAGLPEDRTSGSRSLQLFGSKRSPREQRAGLVAEALAKPLARRPGAASVYSNTGFLVAGAAIERIRDAAFEDVMRSELFEPLALVHAGFGAPGRDERSDSVTAPWGHRVVLGEVVAMHPEGRIGAHPERYGPAGNVHCSLDDWASFARVHLGTVDYLPEESRGVLHTPVEGSEYTCGLVVTRPEWSKHPVFAHHGSSAGWWSSMVIAPDDGFAILAVCNRGGDVGRAACAAALELAREARPRPRPTSRPQRR